MQIDRHELAKEIFLREHIQKVLKSLTNSWQSETKSVIVEHNRQEKSLRRVVRSLIPKILFEDSTETKQDVAISLVRDTLLAVVKIIKADQSKFKDPEVQDGFIKYCMLALQNDFEEDHGEEGEENIEGAQEIVLQEFLDDGDDRLDIKIKPSDHAMFIDDKEEEEGEVEIEEEDPKETREEELFLTLSDAEKVGFRYAKETTWPKVTKQIKRIHKMALPDPEIAAIYEEWLTKNIELHGENTKEESTFESNSEEVEEEEFSF
jgi:hypothetical protein